MPGVPMSLVIPDVLEEGCTTAMNCDCASFTPVCANGTCTASK